MRQTECEYIQCFEKRYAQQSSSREHTTHKTTHAEEPIQLNASRMPVLTTQVKRRRN